MWDAMFMGMRSMGRDESMIEYGLKVLMVSSQLPVHCRRFPIFALVVCLGLAVGLRATVCQEAGRDGRGGPPHQ